MRFMVRTAPKPISSMETVPVIHEIKNLLSDILLCLHFAKREQDTMA